VRFIRADKKGERCVGFDIFLKKGINGREIIVNIPTLSYFFKRELFCCGDVAFSGKSYPVPEGSQIVSYTFSSLFGIGMVWMGPCFYRIEACVKIVPGGRTHGGCLVATLKLHSLFCQLINDRSVTVAAAVASKVGFGAVIRKDEEEVGPDILLFT